MNPNLGQALISIGATLGIFVLAMFLVSFTCSVIETVVKKIITHYYSTKLTYMQSLAEQPEQKPLPFGRPL